MIEIDMKIPNCCENCPCSHNISSGPHEYELMCCVKEYRGSTVAESIVERINIGRDPECPMKEV